MGINENGDGASYPLFRSVSFVQKMINVDKKLLRRIRESDTRVIEKRGVNDEEEDENVKALKRQLAEMKQLMKKNAKNSPGKIKKYGRKKKPTKKTKPHPPLLKEKNHVVQQSSSARKASIESSAFAVPKKSEEKKNKKKEHNVDEKEKEKAEKKNKKKEHNMEEKEKEKAEQQLEKMDAKSTTTTPIKSKPESQELIAKKMAIMKKIRNLKLSLLSIEDEADKISVKKKIDLLTSKLTNLTEEDVINDTKEEAEGKRRAAAAEANSTKQNLRKTLRVRPKYNKRKKPH